MSAESALARRRVDMSETRAMREGARVVMPVYQAPLRDYRFLLHEVLHIERHANLPGFADATPDLVAQVLEEGARFSQETLQPLNAVGDREGCSRQADGSVVTPSGFREAYRKYVEAGWPLLGAAPEFGGQGLPHIVHLAFSEMVSSA